MCKNVTTSGRKLNGLVDTVIDAYSKFTWLYPTRSMDSAEATNLLENQRHVSETSHSFSAFEDCCNKQNVLNISITPGLPRSNSQIEKQNSTIIAVLSKHSVDNPEK
ncbi:transposon Ty3-I Gag-Pol polyprotein [Trichonephila inaurata madagascariensis]|uniref:Transposon Ty3-I Gag-Pol polyprotein n=1 Tax=Trichonephila inaurata madagascariensis TaxID=2747483 RepID=A0A8X6Y746_9ARAC|nr:transposon Ty3-I Gag-Pol polyprotein [Trichonephila inaurata madagascariensis]